MDKHLWEQICQFDLDFPVSDYGFSMRLAAENVWTFSFTQQAILEYKKFMFLAATQNEMVSPSEIVDIVWHQHLIFTQSYTAFCAVLGKRIEHIPSTHSKKELEILDKAKARTSLLYNECFGAQPEEVWLHNTMLDSLPLTKANLSLKRKIFTIVAIFLTALIPAYGLLFPVYVTIGNPDFLIILSIISILAIGLLHKNNTSKLNAFFLALHSKSFIFSLKPEELIFLDKNSITKALHSIVNKMVAENKLLISSEYMLSTNEELPYVNSLEYAVWSVVKESGTINYPDLLQQVRLKPGFRNIENSMNLFKKHFADSTYFRRLFYVNLIVLILPLFLGCIRLMTGFVREKNIQFLFFSLVVYCLVAAVFLGRLYLFSLSKTLSFFYKKNIVAERQLVDQDDWSYYVSGNVALAAAFIPMVTYVDSKEPPGWAGSDSGTSGGCGSGGDGGCAGGCGGCGGGD